jgi:hypothetical protein
MILMKLHIRHLQIQFAKVTIAGVLDSPVLVLFSSVTRLSSGSGNPAEKQEMRIRLTHTDRHRPICTAQKPNSWSDLILGFANPKTQKIVSNFLP